MLRRDRHKCAALQQLWNQEGENSFEFRVLERCAAADLVAREEAWIRATSDCLNTHKGVTQFGPLENPSPKLREAAVTRWARPDYRAKREPFLKRREQGRFLPVERPCE